MQSALYKDFRRGWGIGWYSVSQYKFGKWLDLYAIKIVMPMLKWLHVDCGVLNIGQLHDYSPGRT